MASVAVSFTFASDSQSFTGNAGSNVTQTSNTGSLVSNRTVKANSSATSTWTRTLTYNTMGVPTGAWITGIITGSLDSQCTTFTSAGAGNTSGAVTLADGTTTVTLSAQRSFSAVDGSPVTTNGTDVTGLNKLSSNSVTITINNNLSNSNTTGSSVILSQDNLNFTLVYQQVDMNSQGLICL